MSDSKALFVLLETAAGYALFEVVAFDEVVSSGANAVVEDTVTDVARFGRAVKLKAFVPFGSASEALENANAISEHAVTSTLSDFLEMNLPSTSSKSGKKSKTPEFSLGVIDPALATAIGEALAASSIGGLSCRSDEVVREILRGCRAHLDHYVGGLAHGNAARAQLGLGHSYSRSKVKFNPARSDNMIIQSIALLDQLDRDVNTFAMRVREWYSWHFPELKDVVKDNLVFARTAAYVGNKQSIAGRGGGTADAAAEGDDVEAAGETTAEGTDKNKYNDRFAGLVAVLGGDEEVAEHVVAAARTSMGMDCNEIDMSNITNFTARMVRLAEFRKQLSSYLSEKMNVVAPNLSALIGDAVGARLISKAGSLTNLAKSPASTVQILGAEKALFRALKTKGNTPKYGLIYHSTFIGRADAKNKGRISRYLANKCSIATRIDSFSDEPSRLYGEKLRDQVEERLKFYETGQAPRRNIDVMEQVSKELKAAAKGKGGDDGGGAVEDKSSSKKKSKKRKSVDDGDGDDNDNDNDKDVEMEDAGADDGDEQVETPSPKKKKQKKDKKRKSKGGDGDGGDDAQGETKETDKGKSTEKKKKKKKKKSKGGGD